MAFGHGPPAGSGYGTPAARLVLRFAVPYYHHSTNGHNESKSRVSETAIQAVAAGRPQQKPVLRGGHFWLGGWFRLSVPSRLTFPRIGRSGGGPDYRGVQPGSPTRAIRFGPVHHLAEQVPGGLGKREGNPGRLDWRDYFSPRMLRPEPPPLTGTTRHL